jgi:bacillithiol system protein YtxJ
MNYKEIFKASEIDQLFDESVSSPDKIFIYFKHSTRCLSSKMAKNIFFGEYSGNSSVYLINVIESRAASNRISDLYKVNHESPQLIVVKNGKCIYAESHSSINTREIMSLEKV